MKMGCRYKYKIKVLEALFRYAYCKKLIHIGFATEKKFDTVFFR